MGTRGFLGFVVDGTEKIAYNHFDSYPEGLGTDVLTWLDSADLDEVTEAARALRVVEAGSHATEDDIERLRNFADPGVASRDTQGNPDLILRAGVIEDAHGFPLDSLFAEWGYIVDIDARTFEVYEGFQRSAHEDGRFAKPQPNDDGYYPCRRVASWKLDELPEQPAFLAAFNESDEDES